MHNPLDMVRKSWQAREKSHFETETSFLNWQLERFQSQKDHAQNNLDEIHKNDIPACLQAIELADKGIAFIQASLFAFKYSSTTSIVV
jgi:hypothetical protein